MKIFLDTANVDEIKEGVALATESIDSGAAQRALERLVAISNGRG